MKQLKVVVEGSKSEMSHLHDINNTAQQDIKNLTIENDMLAAELKELIQARAGGGEVEAVLMQRLKDKSHSIASLTGI